MIRIKNTEKLESWLEENLKMPFGDYDINAVMDEIENQRGASGSNHYELRSWETKSGNPECYYYGYEFELDEDGNIVSETYRF